MEPIKSTITESIQPILNNSNFVSLNRNRLQKLALVLKDQSLPDWDNESQLKENVERTVQYYFFLDSINFCFWAPKGQPKWQFEMDGEWTSGYYAYSYAIKKAFQDNPDFYDANYLAEISFKEFQLIFKGRNELLLQEKRWQIIRENFQILAERFNGRAVNIVEEAKKDVNYFIDTLLENFPTFRDEVEYQNHKVYFLKRAQILPSDISYSLPEAQPFTNLDDLSIFADYKLPQLLQAEGVLEYTPELLNKVKMEELIEPGSQAEIEIRAWTIEACALLLEELKRLGRALNNQELDWILWVLAKQRTFALPHHKTLTTYY